MKKVKKTIDYLQIEYYAHHCHFKSSSQRKVMRRARKSALLSALRSVTAAGVDPRAIAGVGRAQE